MLAYQRLRIVGIVVSLGLLAEPAVAQLPAFPGAVGFGATATGGRGGEVYHVTHLGDTGPGSLRDAVSSGPRVVVFDVGGYVELKSLLRIGSHVTIAGQTAPGDGIGTKNYEVSFSGARNVIVRYVRFRLGDTAGQETRSAVVMTGSQTVILDHCSIQFGQWEALQLIGSSAITIQNSLIGPTLGRQLGCLCASDDVTFSHNLFASNFGHSIKARGKVQFANNVIYNWQHDAFADSGMPAGATAGATWYDLVGNYFLAGPATERTDPFVGGSSSTHVYASGNYVDRTRDGKRNGTLLTDAELGPVTLERTAFAAPAIAVPTESADAAYAKVVAGAGCSLHRDALDTRLVDDLQSLGKKGKLISKLSDVGGLGTLRGGATPRDTDGDGIPDAWELTHNLDPKLATDRNTLDKSGYTMLEVYLNSLADSTTVPGTNTFTLAVNPPSVTAKPGTSPKLTVTVTRRGYDGPLNLDVNNLPTGVTAAPVTVGQGQTTATIQLTAVAGATGNRSDVVVRGTPTNGKPPVNSPAFTVQTQGTNFTLKLTPAMLRFKAGASATVQVTTDRKDYLGAINVQLHGLPAHVKAAPATIPAGQNSVTISLTADAKANGSGNIVAHGTAGNTQHDSPPITITVTKK